MFYEPGKQNPKTDMGLAYDPWKALVQPRPIGWISTLCPEGKANLAPYSFYNAICSSPPMVMFSSSPRNKDTAQNIVKTGEFVVNIVTPELLEKMVETSRHVPHDQDEFELAGLAKRSCTIVKAPAVAESPAHLECKVYKTIELPRTEDNDSYIIFIGEVVGIYIDGKIIKDGKVDFHSVGRLGYQDYSIIDTKRTVMLKR